MEAGLEGEEPKGAPAGGGSSLEVQVWMKVQVMRCCRLLKSLWQGLRYCKTWAFAECVPSIAQLDHEALVHFLFD